MTKTHLVERLTARVTSQDADGCAECYTDDAELITPVGTMRGKDEIRSFFDSRFGAYSEREIQEDLTDEDGEVDCVAVLRLTHTGPLVLPGGETLEATGKRIQIDAHERYSFEGDLITKHVMEFDPEQAASQLTAST